jgi:hypothetical protein
VHSKGPIMQILTAPTKVFTTISGSFSQQVKDLIQIRDFVALIPFVDLDHLYPPEKPSPWIKLLFMGAIAYCAIIYYAPVLLWTLAFHRMISLDTIEFLLLVV